MITTKKVRRTGSTLSMTIPVEVTRMGEIDENFNVQITYEGGRIMTVEFIPKKGEINGF